MLMIVHHRELLLEGNGGNGQTHLPSLTIRHLGIAREAGAMHVSRGHSIRNDAPPSV